MLYFSTPTQNFWRCTPEYSSGHETTKANQSTLLSGEVHGLSSSPVTICRSDLGQHLHPNRHDGTLPRLCAPVPRVRGIRFWVSDAYRLLVDHQPSYAPGSVFWWQAADLACAGACGKIPPSALRPHSACGTTMWEQRRCGKLRALAASRMLVGCRVRRERAHACLAS